MLKNYRKQIEDKLKTFMLLEYLGIHIEDKKQIINEYGACGIIYYLSVPETSTIELDPTTEEISTKIKCADGLISIAKKEILNMPLDVYKTKFDRDKDNTPNYFKFHTRVRNGEVWNKELGDTAIKKFLSDVKKNFL